jgi:hypothetical protein
MPQENLCPGAPEVRRADTAREPQAAWQNLLWFDGAGA